MPLEQVVTCGFRTLHTSDRSSIPTSPCRSARQGRWIPDLYDLVLVAGWEPHILHDLYYTDAAQHLKMAS